MKIVITGSLGNISKPLTEALVHKGHSVTVISSNPERKPAIEILGAKAAIGSIQDVVFLTTTFTGADAVYCMIPPFNYFDPNIDVVKTYRNIAGNYTQAIRQSGVTRVVHLSSIGAHTDKGNGLLRAHHYAENILKALPSDIAIVHMRPTAFYYNLYGFVNGIKARGIIEANYGADDKVPWVSHIDIAAAVADEIATPFVHRKVRYVVSDEPTCHHIASTLGAAIGNPDLKWTVISDKQMQHSLEAIGMQPYAATGLTKMNASMHSGALFEDYYRNKPELGKVKIEDFAKEFAAAFK